MMSPEPSQEPIEENLSAPNLTDTRMTNDSDSEDEDAGMAGYIPLSQIPTDSDLILGDEEEEEWTAGSTNQAMEDLSIDSHQEYSSETIEVWSTTSPCSDINLDAEKINQVKSMMAAFTLPTTAIPEWANAVSEEQWKEQLMGRIKEIQNKDK
ncbi:male-enhanced antigen 1 [Prorops nasuta]|uniref:male-enhanced antigen 1 n=1 Tax=Prorops nasuta TaxID=863751 RepID=UPI0034CDC628